MITKIIIPSSGIIDLQEDIPLSFNYNIADIRHPDKKHGNYSKTITIPGSANNNKMFMHIFEIGIDRQFNPNKKAKAWVMVAETIVFKGYLQLLKINQLRDRLQYEVVITGKLSNIFNDLKDKKLNELNWDDLDHIYNKANQKASWTAAVGEKYIYGFIDYGYSINDLDYNVNYFFPGVYLKEYIDRIFKEAGYQYTSAFFTSNFFKRLFIPFTGDRFLYTAAEIKTRQFHATRTAIQDNIITSTSIISTNKFTIIFNDDSTGINIDTSNQYNTSTGEWTVGKTGYYIIKAYIQAKVITDISSPISPVEFNGKGNFEIYNTTAETVLGSSPIIPYEITDPATFYCGNLDHQVISEIKSYYLQTVAIYLQAGDKIIVRHNIYKHKYVTCSSTDNNTYTIRTSVDVTFNNLIIPEIKDGDSVVVKDLISSDIKQSTFFAAILQMFNLYTETDPDNDTILLIEPRKDFYNSTVVNWSDLLDESQDLVIEPMGALDNKSYLFTYKEDSDFLNKLHQEGHGHVYGRRRIEVDNDFLKSEMKIESIFSATPQYSENRAPTNYANRNYPKIINVDKDGNIIRKRNNLRLLYFSGIFSVGSWDYWRFNSAINGLTVETTYPHCGHINDTGVPTIDLSFGVPTEVYFAVKFGNKYTNNNLYNVYWREEIEEITDKNSSIVTGWFRLRTADIFSLDFRKLYVFKNQQFRLNKVIDYNPTTEGLTKCEFIKVKLVKPFVATSVDLLGSSDELFEVADATSLTPIIRTPATPGGNSPSKQERNLIIGSNNKVSEKAIGVLVVGSDNFVGDDAQNIIILNSSGVIVSGGLQNIDVRNSSGVIINDSNTTIMGQPPVLGRSSEFAAIGFAAKADSSAFMDIRSTSKGFLMPRMNKAQKDAIVTPANGLIVYQTDTPIGFQYYQGGGATWRQMVNTADLDAYALLAGRATGQTLIGGTAAGDDLILRATSNATDGDIIFQSDPTTERMRITSAGKIGIGNPAPAQSIDVILISNSQDGIQILNGSSGTGAAARLDLGVGVGWSGPYCTWAVYPQNFVTASARGIVSFSTAGGANGFRIATQGSIQLMVGAGYPERARILATGEFGIGLTVPTAVLHLKAGTATASTAPLKFNSGTNLTTAENGAMEYNGTNLFFTRTGAVREGILTQSAVSVISPTAPNRTITVNIDGTTYYITAKTTND